jgi:O-acetyl-ADP-ribose deacetylase (regulator of RNase III)
VEAAVKVVDGDLLDITDGLIAHQVNCRGVMGAGVARVIAKRYPDVEAMYRQVCAKHVTQELLGTCLVVTATNSGAPTDNLWVANVFGQLNTGRGLQTSYTAVANAVEQLADVADFLPDELHVPYMMGCGLAGGDWDVYSTLLDEHWPGDVIAHRLVPR